jgi:cyanophycin synthetase
MNLFNLGHYHALVDYAHNAASYEALGGFVLIGQESVLG